jgi:hypothetical protein
MKITNRFYGQYAKQINQDLGLNCAHKEICVPAKATFVYRNVEGRIVIDLVLEA